MTIGSVDHFQQKIVGIDANGRDRSLVEVERPQARHHTSNGSAGHTHAGETTRRTANAKFDAHSRLPQLTDQHLRWIAVYIAGGLVAGGVMLAARNVGSERHDWWGWLLISSSLSWLSFLGLIAVTIVTLRVAVGTLRWSLSLISRMPVPARVGLPACVVVLAGAFAPLIGPAAAWHRIEQLADFMFPCAIVIAVGSWLAVLAHRHYRDARRRWQRHAGYAVLAPVAAAAVLAVGARDTLAAQYTVVLLLPVAVWLALRTLRTLTDAR